MEREQAMKFMSDLLRALLAKKGSDLFISATFPPACKIDGRMTPLSDTTARLRGGGAALTRHPRLPAGRGRPARPAPFGRSRQ